MRKRERWEMDRVVDTDSTVIIASYRKVVRKCEVKGARESENSSAPWTAL